MPVSAAYLAVILIWSTTPLGIVWSSESVSPTLAVLLRYVDCCYSRLADYQTRTY